MVPSCQVVLLKFYIQFDISRGTGTSTSTDRLLRLILKLESCNTDLRKPRHCCVFSLVVSLAMKNSYVAVVPERTRELWSDRTLRVEGSKQRETQLRRVSWPLFNTHAITYSEDAERWNVHYGSKSLQLTSDTKKKTKTRFFLDEVTICELILKEFESRSALLFLPSLFAANISDPVQLFVTNPSTWEQSR